MLRFIMCLTGLGLLAHLGCSSDPSSGQPSSKTTKNNTAVAGEEKPLIVPYVTTIGEDGLERIGVDFNAPASPPDPPR